MAGHRSKPVSHNETKLIAGGAPVNDKCAFEIEADGYAADAGGAVALVKELVGIV